MASKKGRKKGSKLYDSLTTKTKVGLTQRLNEKVLMSRYNLNPYFWNKKKCLAFNQEVYNLNSRLYNVLGSILKVYDDDIVLATFEGFKIEQLKKMCEMIKYNKVGQVIKALKYYCGEELKRIERINAPKDSGDPDPIVFDPGKDLRDQRVDRKKISTWGFLNGTERITVRTEES